MPEAPAKVSKTYLSKIGSLSFAWTDENNKKATIQFLNGKFTTDDAGKQAHVEGSDGFGKYITLAPVPPTPREILVKDAADLGAAADKAKADAKAAADALAAFDAAEKAPALVPAPAA